MESNSFSFINRVSSFSNCLVAVVLLLLFCSSDAIAQNHKEWLHFKPANQKAKNKKIVLVSGDEEYRSEESLPMLAKILTEHHGFETIVLFAINPNTKQIDPEYQKNIPGLSMLQNADLLIIATRFRELPDDQMKYIDQYLKAGKPVIGLRTATHAFNYAVGTKSSYKQYAYDSKVTGWEGGFGKLVLGETWINHHGDHGKEGTRALVNGTETIKDNPILRGVTDIWGASDVYGLSGYPKKATILLFGQPTEGMDSNSAVNWKKTILPIAWTRTYQIPNGKAGKAFTTTMGASVDLLKPDLRRLIVNAAYWAVGLDKLISADAKVDFVGTYKPIMFGFGTYEKGKYPQDYQ